MISYSLLTTNKKTISDKLFISEMLSKGIKLLLFCSDEEKTAVEKNNDSFIEAKLLNVFPTSFHRSFSIEDGKMDYSTEQLLRQLSEATPEFNFEQYVIEHADPNRHVFIEAGAGTGKTTVMIDRIMFLLHTVPDISFNEIGMITFTNEATQNMKRRIQNALFLRYRATGLPRYTFLLEDLSGLHIQTIHSFSKEIIEELGTLVGLGNNMSLKSFTYEKKQLIREVLNDYYGNSNWRVDEVLGTTLPDAINLIFECWNKLDNIGLTDDSVKSTDWGTTDSPACTLINQALEDAFPKLIVKYNELKREKNAISISDIIRELQNIISSHESPSPKSIQLKYLFVDEFQDSDNAQIKMLAWLISVSKVRTFVVGDIKQSIYRFRGAIETAFKRFETLLKELDDAPIHYSLNRNYRTYHNVLNDLDYLFRSLEKRRLLDYGNKLLALKKETGIVNVHPVLSQNAVIEATAIKVIKQSLADCSRVAAEKGIGQLPEHKVVALTRTNYELDKIERICADNGIPCYIQRQGTFFQSQAIRDFFVLVKSFVFQNEAIHLFDYINSPYSGTTPEYAQLVEFAPNSNEQIQAFRDLLLSDDWDKRCQEFRFRPALTVLREIVSEKKPSHSSPTCPDLLSRLQYDANLDKLFGILRKHFLGDMASLYGIYEYLKIQINTNNDEDEPDISKETDCTYLYGMTVHKAKGLEFDTVIIPFTNRQFFGDRNIEIIIDDDIDPVRIGWKYRNKTKGETYYNDYYNEYLPKEKQDVRKEESRLLYVALTRCIRRLEVIKISNKKDCWADLMEVCVK